LLLVGTAIILVRTIRGIAVDDANYTSISKFIRDVS